MGRGRGGVFLRGVEPYISTSDLAAYGQCRFHNFVGMHSNIYACNTYICTLPCSYSVQRTHFGCNSHSITPTLGTPRSSFDARSENKLSACCTSDFGLYEFRLGTLSYVCHRGVFIWRLLCRFSSDATDTTTDSTQY